MAPIRGASFERCSTAIADAAIADATARQEREEARQQRNEAAARAVLQRPWGIALVEPQK